MPFDNINYDQGDSILRNLIAARALIADERNWTPWIRKMWRGDNDFAFCALGAVEEVMGTHNWHRSAEVKRLAATSIVPFYRRHDAPFAVAHHNNTRGHAATLEMFDKAISARRVELEAVHAV